MRNLISLYLAANLLTVLAAGSTALAQHRDGHSGHGRASASPGLAARAQTPATREYRAAHQKMMQAMGQPYTGDPDADFRIQMIPHHQGAIDMARVAMRRAADPWTRQMAEAVIVEQQREIYDMQAWLARRGFRVPEGGQPLHVIGSDSYRTLPPTAGSLDETQASSWTPGSGVPRQP